MTQQEIIQHYMSRGAILFMQSHHGPTIARNGNPYAQSFWAGYDGKENPYPQHMVWHLSGLKLKLEGR